jgi:chemotaxis-related protein WspD
MTSSPIDFCWSRIGVAGDGSCVELARVIHCRNCEVYARAGRALLEQAPPAEYLEHWAAQLAAPAQRDDQETLSTVLFRVAAERLALPTTAFVEAIEVRRVHRVPHRSSAIFLGLANVRGELQLCVSLAALLSIEPQTGEARPSRPRFAVIERGGQRWVFPVDELLGVQRVARDALTPPPATVAGDAQALTGALFELAGERIALLDADLLFARLARVVT